jgi:hypothetical protein
MYRFEGNLKKMFVSIGPPVQYELALGDAKIKMNTLIGNEIKFQFLHQINCIACNRAIKKSFGQGFCYPCFINSPMNSECIIRPELCEAHLGKGRNPEWEKINHLQEHIVYLALSGGLKVGVTRHDQIPIRWIDQGASEAIVIARTPYRALAGEIEVFLKNHLSDKTNWQRMLKNINPENISLSKEKDRFSLILKNEFEAYLDNDELNLIFDYPVDTYPQKIKSLKFDKFDEIKGVLTGIRGQYIYLDNYYVLNIRNQSGYLVALEY